MINFRLFHNFSFESVSLESMRVTKISIDNPIISIAFVSLGKSNTYQEETQCAYSKNTISPFE